MRFARLAGLLLSIVCLVVWEPASQAQQSALVATPQPKPADPLAHPRLFYIGLALYSEPWSQNDVAALADALRQTTGFDVVPLIASNFLGANPRVYPIADDATIASMVHNAAERARPDDVVFVHISTHGGHGVLASKIGDRQVTALSATDLAHDLAPLGQHPTIIVISACYSGSLIPAVRSPERIVITAARADRSSFGCAASSRHTFFGEAELRGFAARNQSLRQVFDTIRTDVAAMEQAKDYRPSLPQIAVGTGVRDLYEAPLF